MKNPSLPLAATVLSMVVGKAISQLRVDDNVSVDNLVNSLAGRGVAIVKSDSSGSTAAELFLEDPRQAGLYWSTSQGTEDIGLGSSGVVLSSAFAKNAEATKAKKAKKGRGDALGGAGSPALDSLLKSRRSRRGDRIVTQDACVLRFQFRCQPPPQQPFPSFYYVTFDFVFGSNNYPSNGKQVNEDLMGAFLKGKNIAVLGKNRTYVSVNTLRNGPRFRNNAKRDGRTKYSTSMRGFTAPLTAKGIVDAGKVYELVLAVADGGRRGSPWGRQGGAWLFIKGESLMCVAGKPRVKPPTTAPALATQLPTRSLYPTLHPTNAVASRSPSSTPSSQPSSSPSSTPSGRGSPNRARSSQPSTSPSSRPSLEPSGSPIPTFSTQPSSSPSSRPSLEPSRSQSGRSSSQPSSSPSSSASSAQPGRATLPPRAPSARPPTRKPTPKPTPKPAPKPTPKPAPKPTPKPTSPAPTIAPVQAPASPAPMRLPTRRPYSTFYPTFEVLPTVSPIPTVSALFTVEPTTKSPSQPPSARSPIVLRPTPMPSDAGVDPTPTKECANMLYNDKGGCKSNLKSYVYSNLRKRCNTYYGGSESQYRKRVLEYIRALYHCKV